MTPLESALLFLVLALPAFWLVHRQFAKLGDPDYLRRQGVVIVLEKVIEAHTGEIGEYMGHPIWETVTFKGMRYRFSHVIDGRRRERIEAGQLFLDPGLVYTAE